MKKENTSIRLKQIMNEKNIKQVDILEAAKPYCKKYNVKLGRNDLSQYVSGKVEPGQQKLTILGLALNVDEVWLMGYDVPRERNEQRESPVEIQAKEDFELIEKMTLLDSKDKELVMNLVDSLLDKGRA